MAITLIAAEGLETSGFERFSLADVSCSISTEVRSGIKGTYCLTHANNSTKVVSLSFYEFQGSANSNAKGIGFWFRVAGTSFSSLIIARLRDAAAVQKIRFRANTDANNGIFYIDNNAGVNLGNATNVNFLNWNFFEVWFQDGTDTADWSLHINGKLRSSGTGAALGTGQSSRFDFGNQSGVVDYSSFWDDLYFAECSSAADLLGNLDIFATIGDGSATTGGNALDAGSWTNVQEIPSSDVNIASYNAATSTTARIAPDTIATQTALTGAVTDIDEDPDSPDGSWLTASGKSTLRVTFPTPSYNPRVGAGLQNFRVLMRKNATGPSGSGNQDLYPDGSVFTLTLLTGAYTAVDEDPDSPDGNWLTASGSNQSTVVRASFGTPTNTPTGTQTFRAWVRKTNHSTNPTAVVELWETGGGTLISTVVTSTAITSTSGQMLSGTWNASSLGTADGSAVQIRVAGSVGGGSPGNRGSVEIGALEWQSAYTSTEFTPAYEIKLYENGSEVVAAGSTTGTINDAGGNTVVQFAWNATNLGTANGSLVECYINQTDSTPTRYIEIGAVEWNADIAANYIAESGWIEADSGAKAGPAGMSALNSIVGLSTFIRTAYSGSGSVLTHSLYRGNDADGVTELSLGNATASNADFFDITQSASIVPAINEHSRIGFGHPAGTDVDIDAAEIITMVIHIPFNTSIVYNSMRRFQHLLVR